MTDFIIPTSTGGFDMGGAGFWEGLVDTIPAPTGGWAMGGAGVWTSSTPIDTEIPADADPTGFYMGGGALPGEVEVVSTIPGEDAIITEGAPFLFVDQG